MGISSFTIYITLQKFIRNDPSTYHVCTFNFLITCFLCYICYMLYVCCYSEDHLIKFVNIIII